MYLYAIYPNRSATPSTAKSTIIIEIKNAVRNVENIRPKTGNTIIFNKNNSPKNSIMYIILSKIKSPVDILHYKCYSS